LALHSLNQTINPLPADARGVRKLDDSWKNADTVKPATKKIAERDGVLDVKQCPGAIGDDGAAARTNAPDATPENRPAVLQSAAGQ
jgi:hypothetical protein